MIRMLAMCMVLIFSAAHVDAQSPQLNPQQEYTIVPAESRIEFYVNSTFMEVNGVFKSWQGKLKVPTPRVEDASLHLQIVAASMTTGSGVKDREIKGTHFFWVKQFPSITFTSTKILPTSDPLKFQVQGDFTLRGVTKPVALQITLDPQGKGHGQIYGDLSFDRRDFGMTYNMPFNRVSDTVRVRMDLDVRISPAPPATGAKVKSLIFNPVAELDLGSVRAELKASCARAGLSVYHFSSMGVDIDGAPQPKLEDVAAALLGPGIIGRADRGAEAQVNI